MAKKLSSAELTTRRIRLLARVLGTISAVLYLSIMILEVAFPHAEASLEGTMLGGLTTFAVISLFLAWRWERIGGAMAVVGGIALGVFAFITAGHNKVPIMFVIGLPILVPGLLYLLSWRREKIQ